MDDIEWEKHMDDVSKENNQKDTPKQSRPHSVLLYLAILFSIAVALILFSFFLHQRNNDNTLQELQTRVDALQQLQDVQSKYDALAEENESLKINLGEVREQLEQSQQLSLREEKTRRAMELLWALQLSYRKNDAAACADLLTQLNTDDLYLFLPETSEYGVESPRQAYQRITQALAS